MLEFDPQILADFPTLRAGVLVAEGVVNGPTPAGLIERYSEEQAATKSRLGETPLADLPSIAAWRRAFRRFGAEPTQYRNAAEALLRRLTKQGDVPSINALVDMGNLVSIRRALPVAVFDLDGIDGGITVRYAEGTEPYSDLGSSETTHPEPGEVVFVDGRSRVHARRWCWRQSSQSATGPTTQRVLVVVEGLHDNALSDVAAALADLEDLFTEYQPRAEISARRLVEA
jgi:DNA/RNA-binding domain of Phe-tRNA-synthetase-like protein